MQTNKEPFEVLMQQNKGIIFKICHSFCNDKDDRDDLAQEILFNLWKAFASFTPDYKFATWMYRIAMNVAISYYRKEKRTLHFSPLSEDLIVLEKEDAGTEVEHNINLLYSFIRTFNEIDKAVIILYLEEKSHQEIAEITGISISNTGTKINRIKERLKTKFSNAKNK